MNKTNAPDLWLDLFPVPLDDGHKYDRGHAVIFGAAELTGATRLAAEAASRIGAGLVSVIADGNEAIYRQTLAADIMVRSEISQVKNPACILAGSGGIAERRRKDVHGLLSQGHSMVLDADMLDAELDWSVLHENCILTPHRGEFSRLFPSIDLEMIEKNQAWDLEDVALLAAEEIGAIIVLKGAQTIIAHPDGRLVVNEHASPYLAKAGTGDVLAGMIAGLLAQKMPPFEAACAGVWLHGEAGRKIGPGLVASDMQMALYNVLKDLLRLCNS